MITFMEVAGDNVHGGDIIITFIEVTGDNVHGGGR